MSDALDELKAALDNEITVLYDAASTFNLPVKLVMVLTGDEADRSTSPFYYDPYVFEDPNNFITRRSGSSDLYEEMKKYNRGIRDYNDFMVLYYRFVASQFGEDVDEKEQKSILISINSMLPKDQQYGTYQEVVDAFTISIKDIIVQATNDRNIHIKAATIKHDLIEFEGIDDKIYPVLRTETCPIANIKFSSSLSSFNPYFPDENGDIERYPNEFDGIDIFNSIRNTKYIPFVKYIDQDGKQFVKVYTSPEEDRQFNIKSFKLNKAVNNNYIYFVLWLGNADGENVDSLADGTKDSFYLVEYNLVDNILMIETPSDEEKDLVSDPKVASARVEKAMSTLVIGEQQELKAKGSFDIFNFEFDETIMLYMIMMDPTMFNFINVDEVGKPFALRGRIDLKYHPLLSEMYSLDGTRKEDLSFTIKQKKVSSGQLFMFSANNVIQPNGNTELYIADTTIETDEDRVKREAEEAKQRKATKKEDLPAFDANLAKEAEKRKEKEDLYYVEVKVNQSGNREDMTKFMMVFRNLMLYYFHSTVLYKNVCSDIAKEINNSNVKMMALAGGEKTRFSRINQLKSVAPRLFPKSYARKCQAQRQPKIIAKEDAMNEVADRYGTVKANDPSLENKLASVNILSYPYEDKPLYFTCDYPDYKYVGVQQNNINEDKDYQFNVCCYRSMQISGNVVSPDYRRFRSRKQTGTSALVDKGAKGAKSYTSTKEISTKKILEKGDYGILPKYVQYLLSTYSNFTNMKRFGIPRGPNSLLACVCAAVGDPNYNSDDESYLQDLREYMEKTIHPGLLKQEMYDYSEEAILKNLGDLDIELDARLYYRAVEELFGINIYMFSYGGDQDSGQIVIPRFKDFPIKPLRTDRATVLILLNEGSESNNLKNEHCELIVDRSNNKKVFENNITEACHEMYSRAYETHTFNMLGTEITDYKNVYSQFDLLHYLKSPGVSQYIDQNGKMRAITIKTVDGPMTIITIPAAPVNLPISSEIAYSTYKTVTTMLGKPSSIDRKGDRIAGLWYSVLDNPRYLYVPIRDEDGTIVSGHSPVLVSEINQTQRLTKLKRDMRLVLHVVRWLYDNVSSIIPSTTPQSFARDYLTISNAKVEDSYYAYDLSTLPRILPSVIYDDEVAGTKGLDTTILEELGVVVPSLFKGNRIVMYNKSFYDSMVGNLRDYISWKTEDTSFIIDDYYQGVEDFEPHKNTEILVGVKEYNSWLQDRQQEKDLYKIHTEIDKNLLYSREPYLLQTADGKIYLIRNTDSYANAIGLLDDWHIFMNIPLPEGSDGENNTVIYGSDAIKKVSPIADRRTDKTEKVYYRILDYGGSRLDTLDKTREYAAMIELL